MKNVKVYCLLFIAVTVLSCLEDKGYTDIVRSVGSENVIASWFGANGIPANKGVVLPAGVTAPEYPLTLSLTSSKKLNKQFSLEVVVDQATIDNANASITSASDKWNLLPQDCYKLPAAPVTIPSDTTETPYVITFYPEKIDKAKNFMLPLKIQDQPGVMVAGNAGTLKLVFIGNPLAGSYTWTYNRWNNATGTGPVTTTFTKEEPFLPVNATTILVQSGYGDQNGFDCRYQLSFTNTAGVLSDFKVKINPADVENSLTPASIVLTDDAKILSVDAINKKFKFTFQVKNSAGAPRTFTDEFIAH